jgi:hypothetical protein
MASAIIQIQKRRRTGPATRIRKRRRTAAATQTKKRRRTGPELEALAYWGFDEIVEYIDCSYATAQVLVTRARALGYVRFVMSGRFRSDKMRQALIKLERPN